MVDFYAPGALGLPGYYHVSPPLGGVAPPGMEHVVQKLKRSKNVQNPWALAWKLKKHGRGAATDMATMDAAIDALVTQAQHGIPAVFVAAAAGEAWAQAWCLSDTTPPLYEEQR